MQTFEVDYRNRNQAIRTVLLTVADDLPLTDITEIAARAERAARQHGGKDFVAVVRTKEVTK